MRVLSESYRVSLLSNKHGGSSVAKQGFTRYSVSGDAQAHLRLSRETDFAGEGFKVLGSGLKVYGLGSRVQALGSRVQGLRFRVGV